MFRRVLEEVDQRILQIRKQLHEKVVKMPQSVEQQKKLIKALTSLEVYFFKRDFNLTTGSAGYSHLKKSSFKSF